MEKAVAAVDDVDPGVLRRRMFATSYLSRDLPNYWEVVVSFVNQESNPGKQDISPDIAKITMENMQINTPCKQMNRCRFEAAHLKLACLQMLSLYSNTISSTPQGLKRIQWPP